MKFCARILLLSVLAVSVSTSAQAQSEGEQYGQLGAPEPELGPGPAPARLLLDKGSMDNAISAMAIFSYFYSGGGFGFGARYQKTIMRDGFLPATSRIQDDFGIEGNFELRLYPDLIGPSDYTQFEILVGAVWNLWFSPTFAVYPKLGFGATFGSFSDFDYSGYGGFTFFGAAGVLWQFDPRFTLRGEIGSDSIQAGMAFTFF